MQIKTCIWHHTLFHHASRYLKILTSIESKCPIKVKLSWNSWKYLIKMSRDTRWRNLEEFVQQRESPKDIFYITIYVSVKRFHTLYQNVARVISKLSSGQSSAIPWQPTRFRQSIPDANRKCEGKVLVFL